MAKYQQLDANTLEGARQLMRLGKHAGEEQLVLDMLGTYPMNAAARAATSANARAIIETSRGMKAERGTLDAFMQEFGLSNQEGVALMCLAEALLRIPDSETQDELISEKFSGGNWDAHRGQSDNMFVNASVWALMLTGRVVKMDRKAVADPNKWLSGLVGKMGEPVIREATNQAMKIMGRQFVFGRTIKEALERGDKAKDDRQLFSFDMLGEGARTTETAERYQALYLSAIRAVGEHAKSTKNGGGHHSKSAVSIKLSALHPKYLAVQKSRVMDELLPRVKEQALLAKAYDMGLTIDAEEADRLDISLDIVEALARDGDLADWNGLGLAVQAYQKRAPQVIDWLNVLARETGRIFPVRLVKGAYWDTEIKHAQEMGYEDYAVWTRKANTDISYLTCAAKMLAAKDAFYCQFATHNAYTVAAIAEMADANDIERMEFQKLHGMGDILYRAAEKEAIGDIRVRTYAPVGQHQDLLPYLVRRLLENGANSSFVNRFMNAKVPVDELAADPYEVVTNFSSKRHAGIAKPADLYGDRKNSRGDDLTNPFETGALMDALAKQATVTHKAAAIVAGRECGAEWHDVTSPINGEVIGSANYAGPDDVERAIATAYEAQPAWNELGGSARADILDRLGDLIEDHRIPLFDLMIREAGKNIEDCIAEVREAADFCRYYALQARKNFAAPMVLKGPTGERNELSLHGRGVFFCIAPWNFPLAIFTGQFAAALGAGNAVLAKPAEQTPLVAAYAVRLAHEAGVPADVLHLILGKGSVLGKQITPDPRIAGVALTGSTGTARLINKTLADKDGPINSFIAETGGQNAMIVDSSALPEQVSDDVMRSAFGSAGQRCSALRVLYIQDSIADKVIHMLKGAVKELTMGHPGQLNTDIGPVIDRGERAGLLQHIARMDKEATLIAKGELPEGFEDGAFLAPHIYEIPSLATLQDEEFGPILHVIRYKAKELDQVMKDIVGTGFGLTFGVHSRIAGRWLDLFKKHRVGNTYVNRNMIGAVVGVQPFGGQGLSGTGPKAGGPHYMLRFATERTMTINTAAIGGNTDLFQLDENLDSN